MNITINDKPIVLADGATLADALAQMAEVKGNVATALNGKVVAAAQRSTTLLHEGDALLVIQPFYGG